jgi:gas vesicle protein
MMKVFTTRQMREMRAHQQARTMSKVGIFTGGMLFGGLIGAAVMLLLAPRSGKRTRTKMQHQYDELRELLDERLEDAEEDLRTQTHRVASNVRGAVKELEHQGKSVFTAQ